MTTYIWHTEYNYYACMAFSLEDARGLLLKHFNIEFTEEPNVILEPGDCIMVEHANE